LGPNSLDRPLFVEDVITAITGGIGGVPARSLRSSMERAAVEFDERTAEAFARALFSELSQNPQDLLGLGNEARMNLPGTAQGNWEWRLLALPDRRVQERLRETTRIYGRAAR